MAGIASAAEPPVATWRLPARVVAVGLPGVAGVRQVGRFHSGGAIPANPAFLLSTSTGRVLDPERILVSTASNFGAPLGDPAQAEGAVLSIDPRPPGTIVIPARFAESGGQSVAAGGAIRLYTAQSAAFANRRYNGAARTGAYTAASGPRYLSMNNAFGRPWIANAPAGPRGAGSVTVVDPDGAPLDNAPSAEAGGVFAGSLTNREWAPRGGHLGWIERWRAGRPSAQLTPGALAQGALGTAFLGPSPDGSGLAVFAAVTADGAVVQIHVRDGVDGLAAAGTVGGDDVGADPGVIGVAFKWNPDRTVFVADVTRDRIVLLHLRDDGRHFTLAGKGELAADALNQPVDIAPAMPEVANPRFASHTTLAGGSDLYVANRGDGSLVRLSQDGRVLARAEIEVPGLGVPGLGALGVGLLGAGRIRAIAVSGDAQRVWLAVEGEMPGFEGHPGALLEVSAFDESGAFYANGGTGGQGFIDTSSSTSDAIGVIDASRPVAAGPSASDAPPSASRDAFESAPAPASASPDLEAVGRDAFSREFTPADGLGPLFNAPSCVTCHPGPGGGSTLVEHFVRRVARMDPVTGRVVPVADPNSPIAHRFAMRETGAGEAMGEAGAKGAPGEREGRESSALASVQAVVPSRANVTSLRMPPSLFAIARLDEIPDAVIEAQAVSKGDGIKGRVHVVTTASGVERVGRFGWKGQIATLDEMVADAFANELGITSALAPAPPSGAQPPLEDDGERVRAVAAYLRSLRPGDGRPGREVAR